jgi:hypothetical protein
MMSNLVDKRIDQCRIEILIGESDMGRVYPANDMYLKHPVIPTFSVERIGCASHREGAAWCVS